MSGPNEGTRATGIPPTSAGRVTADGKRVFQMTTPLVIWWVWIVLLVVAVADLLIQGHQFVTLKFGFGALAVTGVVYACAVWPKVVADDVGMQVRNPFRVFNIPWPAVRGIFLADSVEVQCARRAARKDKTVYSWALASPRRSRARAQLRAWQWDQGKRSRPSGYQQLPEAARSLVKMTTAEIMARELAAMSDEFRFKSVVHDVDIDVDGGQAGSGEPNDPKDPRDPRDPRDEVSSDRPADAGPGIEPPEPDAGYFVTSTWAWLPILAIALPTVGWVVTTLVT